MLSQTGGLDRLELKQELFSYYHPEEKIFVTNRPTMICIALEMINPDTRVNSCNMKDKLCTINILQFNEDIEDILTKMEELNSLILAEGEEHQNFNLDLLNALKTVQDSAFINTIDKLQVTYNGGETVTPTHIIKKANRKY